jgi:multidrug efflux pump subunit AcrA (membrane-fusion protein)
VSGGMKDVTVQRGDRVTKGQVVMTLYSTVPISGVVVERLKEPGEFVDETPFIKIVSLDPINAEIVLPAEWYGQVNKTTPVTLYTIGSDQGVKGKIKIVDPVIDAASSTFAVIVELDNAKQTLAAGLRCRAVFDAPSSN